MFERVFDKIHYLSCNDLNIEYAFILSSHSYQVRVQVVQLPMVK
jgi:hypothetical protein